MKINRTLFAAAALLLLGACNAGWHLAAAPWARPTAAGGNAAIYFALHNATGHDDALLSASSDVAAAVEIHQSMEVSSGDMGSHQAAGMQGNSALEAQDLNTVGSMAPVERIDIANDQDVEFAPGGYHVMLSGLTRELKTGDHFTLVLHFENSGDLLMDVTVIEQ
jgi:hypothetical protein